LNVPGESDSEALGALYHSAIESIACRQESDDMSAISIVHQQALPYEFYARGTG
jgi:hypothetical protein